MADEAAQPTEYDRLTALPDTDDLPSANPNINKFNNAVKDPSTGKFVSTRAATPNTDTPPPPEPETVEEPAPVAQPTPAPQAQPQLSPVLRTMAQRLGIPNHLLQGDPEQLRRDIELAYRLSQQQPATPQQPAQAQAEDDFDLGINDADYPEFSGKLKGHLKKIKSKVEEQEAHLKQLLEQNAQYRQQQEVAQFEQLCAKHPEVFGAGSYNDLNPQSVEATRRAMLYQQVSAFYQGRPWANLDQAFNHFSQVFVGGKPTPKPEPKVDTTNRITPEQWARAGTLPASNRAGTDQPLSRYERLIRQEAEKMNLNGRAAVAAGFDDNSDLPKHPG